MHFLYDFIMSMGKNCVFYTTPFSCNIRKLAILFIIKFNIFLQRSEKSWHRFNLHLKPWPFFQSNSNRKLHHTADYVAMLTNEMSCQYLFLVKGECWLKKVDGSKLCNILLIKPKLKTLQTNFYIHCNMKDYPEKVYLFKRNKRNTKKEVKHIPS